MALHRATKDHYERETDEANRLVRPAPKVKPPRKDLRKEQVDTDDKEKQDQDLSMNYKTIGGSTARVIDRWLVRQADASGAGDPNKVRVRKKDTGWVGYVNKETLKEPGNQYEVVENDEEEESPKDPTKPEPEVQEPRKEDHEQPQEVQDPDRDRAFLEEVKGDPNLESFAKSLSSKNPTSIGGLPDSFSLSFMPSLMKQYPALDKYKFRTLGDIRNALKSGESAGPKGKGKGKSKKDVEKQKALVDQGEKIREMAKDDHALKTIVQQLDSNDTSSLYHLKSKLDPEGDISTTIPGLPPEVKNLKDLSDAVNATKPGAEKPPEAEPEEESDGEAPEEPTKKPEKAKEKKPEKTKEKKPKGRKAEEVEAFVNSKKQDSPEFKEWANGELTTVTGDNGEPLFFDDEQGKHVPFDQLSDNSKYEIKNDFESGQKLKGNVEGIKSSLAKNPHIDRVLKDLVNEDSDLFREISKLGRNAQALDIKKAIPELKDVDLPKGLQTVGDLIDVAHQVHKPPPKSERRKASPEEVQNSKLQIIKHFPVELASKYLDMNLHPDDVRDMVETYATAKAHAGEGELTKLVKDVGYETDPTKVKPPKVGVDKYGEEVPFEKLTPAQQAAAMDKHRVFVVAMSLAAREKEVERLVKKTKAPKELVGTIADMTLNHQPGESDGQRVERAKEQAKHIFVDAVKRGLMSEDTDKYARWQAKRDKLVNRHMEQARDRGEEYDPDQDTDLPPPPVLGTVSQVQKLLHHFDDDEAVQHVVVGWAQAADYLSARQEFLSPDSPEAISEHQTPRDIANKVKKMSDFFDERAKEYPESMRDLIPAKSNLRRQIVEKIRTLAPEKYPFVSKLVQEQEFDDYEDELKRWQKAYEKHHKEHSRQPYRQNSDFQSPPRRPEGYLETRGGKDGKEEKNDLFDKYRRHMGPAGVEKTAHMLWSVVDRHLVNSAKDSTCRATRTMGTIATRVAERAKKSVYWGVEPYPKGHEGFAPYTKWEQVHQRDLGDSDYSTILTAAREWLRAPVLSSAVDGIYRDTQLRAALDLALRSCENGKYSVGLQPPLYNMLLARLGGAPPNQTLLTDRSNITGPITVTGSLYAPTGLENPMNKSAALIHRVAAKYAASNPQVAYDLIELAGKVAQDEGQQEPAQQDQKQGGQVPPQFLEHMKKKEEGGGEKKEDQGQGQGQQKDASAARYTGLRTAVIRLAAANPNLRAAYLPLLETIKRLG